MMSTTMGEGERAEARRRARTRLNMLGSMVCAILIVVAAAWFKQSGGRIAPAGAIAIVVLYLTAMTAFCWRASLKSDEVEMRHNLVALASAAGFYIMVYPAWYFLWKGGLLIEPRHDAMYAAMIAVATLGYCWSKFRR